MALIWHTPGANGAGVEKVEIKQPRSPQESPVNGTELKLLQIHAPYPSTLG